MLGPYKPLGYVWPTCASPNYSQRSTHLVMGFCSWMNLSLASKRHAFQTWIGRNSKEPVVENVETSPYYWPLLIKTTRKLSTIETRLMRVDFATKWNWRSTSCRPCLLQCLEWFSTAAADSCPGWKSALSMVYLCRTALSLPEILENTTSSRPMSSHFPSEACKVSRDLKDIGCDGRWNSQLFGVSTGAVGIGAA